MAHQTHAPPNVESMQAGYGRAREDEGRSGWLVFAAVMFFAAAVANALYGISALVNDDYFTADELLFGDLSMWGAIYLGFAVLQLAVGVLILRRSAIGVVSGVVLALLHGTLVLMTIGGYPVWSVIALVVDGLIIYGLTVHGSDREW